MGSAGRAFYGLLPGGLSPTTKEDLILGKSPVAKRIYRLDTPRSYECPPTIMVVFKSYEVVFSKTNKTPLLVNDGRPIYRSGSDYLFYYNSAWAIGRSFARA